ncbi:rhomboid family intramembrane serine protease [Pseudotabrizicola formosa]|uniref:rhomboid family intramembrane serine protease n=1 Tax=Pseudotabrizicola formosa TaxID=2030009 RepID=UPI000CD0EEB2|nr:rhomboid family intramembrane serine protease [Pseudotabrizicola formosa]
MQDMNAAPLNPLPLVVWALALPMIAMELVLAAAGAGLIGGPEGIGWRLQVLEGYSFWPEQMRYLLETGQYPLDGMHRLVTYPFVHGNLTHVVFAVVILLALGKMVGEVFRWWAVLLVFFTSAIVGAMVYTLVLPGVQAPLIGGYPAVYGLIGGFTFLLWVNLAAVGANKYRAFTLIGFLLAFQLLFGLLFGGGYEWVADLTGFATGFVLSFLVSPGGWGRVLEKVRQR